MNENEILSTPELIQCYAEINGISIEEATQQVNADTPEQVLKNIQDKTMEKVNAQMPKLNRAQRRALAKKNKGKNKNKAPLENQIDVINETATKLNYIDLIQKLRALNEQKEKEIEENETATEND